MKSTTDVEPTASIMRPLKVRRRAVIAGVAVACAAIGTLAPSMASADTPPSPVHFSNTPVASWRAIGPGYATLLVGTVVYVGGAYTTVTSPDGATSVPRGNLAAFDSTTGALITTFRADTNGAVRALAYDAGTNLLYVGGSFTKVNGVSRQRLAAVDPATGALSATWRPQVSSNVYGLAVASAADKLFVAGSFGMVNGITRPRAAAVALDTGALDPTFNPTFDDTTHSVSALSDGSRAYYGGIFTTVNGVAAKYLVQLDGTGVLLRSTWQNLTGRVLAQQLSADGTRLAISAGGAGNQGAWYDTTTGQRYWYQRCDGDGQGVHVIGGSMFTGFHEGCNGDTTIRLVSNSIATGARDTAFAPTFDQFWGVRAIGGDASALVIAGEFTNVSGVAVQGFAIFPPLP